MKIYISGGAKNGKSAWAEERARKLAAGRPLYYVATMLPADGEDLGRIARHVASRAGKGFITIERSCDLSGLFGGSCGAVDGPGEGRPAGCPALGAGGGSASGPGLRVDPDAVFLVDSVTALLANRMFPPGGRPDPEAAEKTAGDLLTFAGRAADCLFVSDYIFSEARHFDDLTEAYRAGLALIGLRLARISDIVAEISCGLPLIYKGEI